MSDRDPTGKFAPGNKASPGRAPRRVEVARLAVLAEAVTMDDWRKVCERALNDAITGEDYNAREKGRRFIADYLIGKPRQTIQINTTQEADDPYAHLSDEELVAIASGDAAAEQLTEARARVDAIVRASGGDVGEAS